MDFSGLSLHAAQPPTIRTARVRQSRRRHFPRPLVLNHPAKSLTNLVGRQLDLIIVRRPAPLIDPLQFRSRRRCLAQQILQFFLQTVPLHIHAICLLNRLDISLNHQAAVV